MKVNRYQLVVEDSSQSSVAGAKVTLLNRQNGARAAVITSGDGCALFSPIVRGTYQVEVTQGGFKSVKLTALQINVDDRRLLRVKLDISSLAETVEVTADAASIQAEHGALGQVISGRTAVELPLAGRRYTELAMLPA